MGNRQSRASSTTPTAPGTRSQIGALPVRGEQILLITSRETQRWVIPKGWPMRALSDADAAAREALEEAGVAGKLRGKKPIGSYTYLKHEAGGATRPCAVSVYLLDVREQLAQWKEADQRTRCWFSLDAAADLVAEPELAALIRSLKTGAP